MVKSRNYNSRSRKSGAVKPSDMLPYPVVVTPPSDPPTVQACPKRHITLVHQIDIGGTSTTPVSVDTVKSVLALASGVPTSKLWFVLEYYHAWAGATGDVDIGMTDTTYGIQAVDSGSYAVRARVGIRYPKNVQKTYYPSETSTTLFEVGASTDVKCDLHIGVTYWSTT